MTRPQFEHVSKSQSKAFVYKLDRDLWQVYHFHHEFDILLVLKNHGEYISGDRIGRMHPGTLIMNGPNVPHALHRRVADERDWKRPASAVIQFSPESVGREFLGKTEMESVSRFLEEAQWGFEFHGVTRDRAHEMILRMEEEGDFERMISLLRLLHLFSESDERTQLASTVYAPSLRARDIDRMDVVTRYLQENKGEVITLAIASELVHLTPKSFCRFFKANTGKTLVQYVNELRVADACKRLLESSAPITEVCFESGFNNVANFNRRFKEIKGMSPRDFRKQAQLGQRSQSMPLPEHRS
jgi:AraC-like DNA-binding protein